MKINPVKLATILAVLAFIGYLLFMLWVGLHKESFEPIWNTWAEGHGLYIESYGTNPVGPFSFRSIFGLVSFTATNWIYGYALAWLYNNLTGNNKDK